MPARARAPARAPTTPARGRTPARARASPKPAPQRTAPPRAARSCKRDGHPGASRDLARRPPSQGVRKGTMNAVITVFYDWSRVVAGYFTWAAPLAVRIVVGWVFLWSGWGKLQILPRIIENFGSWGIPAPEVLAPFVSGMEFVGGL